MSEDNIDHPDHYNQGSIEVIDIIEDWGLDFKLGSVVKYVLRAPYKGNQLEDLKKAKWFLQRCIDKLEESEEEKNIGPPFTLDDNAFDADYDNMKTCPKCYMYLEEKLLERDNDTYFGFECSNCGWQTIDKGDDECDCGRSCDCKGECK